MIFKILLAATMLATATSALAGEGGHYGGHHGSGGGNWVAPFVGGAIVGGMVGGAMSYPYTPYYAAPSPYYSPTPYQPYYRWDCNSYGQCGWVWR